MCSLSSTNSRCAIHQQFRELCIIIIPLNCTFGTGNTLRGVKYMYTKVKCLGRNWCSMLSIYALGWPRFDALQQEFHQQFTNFTMIKCPFFHFLFLFRSKILHYHPLFVCSFIFIDNIQQRHWFDGTFGSYAMVLF